jgi:hypothetical protein
MIKLPGFPGEGRYVTGTVIHEQDRQDDPGMLSTWLAVKIDGFFRIKWKK